MNASQYTPRPLDRVRRDDGMTGTVVRVFPESAKPDSFVEWDNGTAKWMFARDLEKA